jgi:hypothetical protein
MSRAGTAVLQQAGQVCGEVCGRALNRRVLHSGTQRLQGCMQLLEALLLLHLHLPKLANKR